MKPRLVVLLCAAVLAGTAACRFGAPPEIRIGLLATFTGQYGELSGIPARNGAALAVRDAGEVRIGGRRHLVRIIERDFEDRGDAAAGAARALINQEQVHALVGPPFSRHAIPVAIVADEAHVPMITTMASNPAVTEDKSWIFRLAFLDDVQGEVLAQFAIRDLRAARAAVLFDISTDYSSVLARRYREVFTALGGNVVAFESYTSDRIDSIGPQMRRIVARMPDVLFLPNFSDAVSRQVTAARRLGARFIYLGSDSWDPPTVAPLLGRSAAYVTNQWRPDIPVASARHFVEAYSAAYQIEPRATAALTYDAVSILLDAMRRAGRLEAAAVRDAISDTRSWSGAGGTVSFAGQANPAREVAVSRVTTEGLVTVALVAP